MVNTKQTLRFTPGPWHVVDYAGFYTLQDGPYYEDNKILDAECVGDEIAKQNAELAALAPKLFALVNKFILNSNLSDHVDYEIVKEAKRVIGDFINQTNNHV